MKVVFKHRVSRRMGKAKRAHHVCWSTPQNWWARPVGLCPSYILHAGAGLL